MEVALLGIYLRTKDSDIEENAGFEDVATRIITNSWNCACCNINRRKIDEDLNWIEWMQ